MEGSVVLHNMNPQNINDPLIKNSDDITIAFQSKKEIFDKLNQE